MTEVEKAIAEAEARSKAVPATVTPANTQVAPMQPARPMALQDFSTGSIVADDFLKVSEHGMTIGKIAGLVEEMVVDLDMSTVQVTEVIKYGDPVKYLKTVDGVKCLEGGTWQQAVERAQQADPKARPYKSADMTLVLVEDAKDLKGNVVAPVGAKLGHSLSTTNRGHFQSLLNDLNKMGVDLTQSVRLKVGYEAKHKNNYHWGLLTFEYLGLTDDLQEAA